MDRACWAADGSKQRSRQIDKPGAPATGRSNPSLALRACPIRSFFLDTANDAIARLRSVGQTTNGLNHRLMSLDFHDTDGAERASVFDRRPVRLPVQLECLSL